MELRIPMNNLGNKEINLEVPIVCNEIEYSLLEREPGQEDYEFSTDVEEYQCRDCGRSFFV